MHAIRHSLKLFGILGAVFLTATPASAQCTDQWLPGDGVPGLGGYGYAAAVYDDGTGPALYVGGEFSIAGEAIANNIARWDGATWSPLGSGINGTVEALTVYSGELIAGGGFTTAGGTEANKIARWDGTNWSPLGSGMNSSVSALTEYNGELIAGGYFTTAGGQVSAYWARWGPDVPLGDLDGDCRVGVPDLLLLLANWGPCADCDDCPADLDGDCTVGVKDLLILLGNWG